MAKDEPTPRTEHRRVACRENCPLDGHWRCPDHNERGHQLQEVTLMVRVGRWATGMLISLGVTLLLLLGSLHWKIGDVQSTLSVVSTRQAAIMDEVSHLRGRQDETDRRLNRTGSP